MYSATVRYDKHRKQFHVVIKVASGHQVWAGWERTDLDVRAQLREWKIFSRSHYKIL